jgi:hypothetical protein
MNFSRCAQQVLDMMSDFMRYDVGKGKIASCAKSLSKLIGKAQVNVHGVVQRTIKWSGSCGGKSTS